MRKQIEETNGFHSDSRGTVVIVNNKVYDLVPSDLTYQSLKNSKPSERPHVRFLAPIPVRTNTEQEKINKDEDKFHELYEKMETPKNSGKITSITKAIKLGADVPKEIERLFKEKEEAQKKGDQKAARAIRQQLRKLNYKRYLSTED